MTSACLWFILQIMQDQKHQHLAVLAIKAWKNEQRVHDFFDNVHELYVFMLKLHGRSDFAAVLESAVTIH